MKRLQCLGVVCLLLFAAQIVRGEYAPIHWDSSGVNLRQGYHIEWQRSGEQDSDGNVIYTWSDTRNGDRDVYAQKMDDAGDQLWGEGGALIARAQGRQEDPSLIPTGFGDYIFIWADFRDDTAKGDIYAQKVDANGNTLWDPLGVLLSTGAMTEPAATLRIVADGTGGAIVVWVDMRNGNEDIYATRIRADGTIPPEWDPNGTVVTVAPASQTGLTVDTDARGGALIGWADNQITAQGWDIYIQRITIDGELAWNDPTGVIVCQANLDQTEPKLCPDGSGGAYNVWWDQRNEEQGDIYFHHVSNNGTLLFHEVNGKPLIVYNHKQSEPRIVADGSGNAIIIWLDQRNDPLYLTNDIYAQKVDSAGTKLWNPSGNAVCTDTANQTEARINTDGAGGAVCVWMDERNGNENPKNNIFAQKINPDGTLAWESEGMPVCEATGYQLDPLVRAFPDRCLIAWGDERSGSIGVWYQQLDVLGLPQLPTDGDTLIWGISGNADNVALVKGENGKIFVFFQDLREGGAGYTAYVQIIDTTGQAYLEKDGRPICPNPSYTIGKAQVLIDACSDGSNGAIAVWQDSRDSNDWGQIYAQRIGPDGSLQWGDAGVQVLPYNNEQSEPRLVSDGEGGAVVVWEESQDDVLGKRIRAGKIDQNSSLIWAVIVADTLGDEELWDIAPDGSGGVYACCRGDTWPEYNLYAQHLDASGTLLWGESRFPICTAPYKQLNGQVIGLGSTGAVFVWEDQRDDATTKKDLYAQKVSFDGTVQWAENGVVVNNNPNDQSNVALTIDGMGNLYVAWEDFRTGELDLYMQKFRILDGQRLFPDSGLAVCTATYEQSSVTMMSDGLGGNYLFWNDLRTGIGIHYDLYCIHLDSSGQPEATVPGWPSPWIPNGNIVCDAFHGQIHPKIIDDYAQGAVVVWEDKRSTGKEELVNLFTQRVNGLVLDVKSPRPGGAAPASFRLQEPFPNPFNPDVKLRFDIKKPMIIRLAVYDILGRQVQILREGWHQPGSHEIVWRADDLASGLYVVQLEGEHHRMEQKIILLK